MVRLVRRWQRLCVHQEEHVQLRETEARSFGVWNCDLEAYDKVSLGEARTARVCGRLKADHAAKSPRRGECDGSGIRTYRATGEYRRSSNDLGSNFCGPGTLRNIRALENYCARSLIRGTDAKSRGMIL
jgi:hypothetical protein